jgi:hypothetical protein
MGRIGGLDDLNVAQNSSSEPSKEERLSNER